MAKIKSFVHASDNLVELTALKNGLDDSIITTATVTARVLEADGTVLSSGISMAHAAGGTYQGTIPDTDAINATLGAIVTIEITADAGAGLKRVFTFPAFVDN